MTENTNTTALFERATRQKTRFPTRAGFVGTEDLWDLPLTSERKSNPSSLNDTAITINAELKTLQDENFVGTASNPRRAELAFQLDVVKHVIGVKQAENAAAADAASKRALRQRLQEELADRQDGKLKTLSEEEIKAQLAALDG